MKNKPKIKYDKESGVLSVRLSDKRSADSEIRGNLVLDYDRGGKLVAFNLYDFSFSDFKRIVKPNHSFLRTARSMGIEVVG